MYTRLVVFELGPEARSRAERVADEVNAVLYEQNGFVSATFFGNDDVGEYGSFTLWETQKDAENSEQAIRSVVDFVKSPKVLQTFEVYHPKL